MRSLVEQVILYNKPVEFDRRYGVSLTELLCNPWKPEDMPRINVPSLDDLPRDGGFGVRPQYPDRSYARLMSKKEDVYTGPSKDILRAAMGGFQFQIRAGEHESYGNDHINFETLNPIKKKSELGPILDNDHWKNSW